MPDFRKPETGIYDYFENEYRLPYTGALYSLVYFLDHPEAFYELAKNYFDLDKYEATPSHYFAKLLHDKGMMSHYFT